jgi:hypothetical protein
VSQTLHLETVIDLISRDGDDFKVTRLTDAVERGAVNGSLRIDAGAAVRRSISLTVVDRSLGLVPGTVGSPLAPPSVIRLQMRLGGGPLKQMGYFTIARPQVQDSGGDMPIQLDGYDKARSISRRRFRQPFPNPVGTLSAAIRNGILALDPGAQFNFAPIDGEGNLPAFSWGEGIDHDPWDDFQKLANEHSQQLFVDEHGQYTKYPNLDADFSPILHNYIEGENHTMVSLSRSFDDEPGYNWVVGRAESPSLAAPLKSEWWDSDPLSSTYAGYFEDGTPDPDYGSNGLPVWGAVPWFFTSNYHTSQAQLDADVERLGKEALRAEHTLSLSALPDPSQGVDEVIRVERGQSKVTGRWLVRSVDLPFDGSAMQLECIGRPEV